MRGVGTRRRECTIPTGATVDTVLPGAAPATLASSPAIFDLEKACGEASCCPQLALTPVVWPNMSHSLPHADSADSRWKNIEWSYLTVLLDLCTACTACTALRFAMISPIFTFLTDECIEPFVVFALGLGFVRLYYQHTMWGSTSNTAVVLPGADLASLARAVHRHVDAAATVTEPYTLRVSVSHR